MVSISHVNALLEISNESSKSVVLYFGGTWCASCLKAEHYFPEPSLLKNLAVDLIFVSCDLDEESYKSHFEILENIGWRSGALFSNISLRSSLMRTLNIRTIPCIISFNTLNLIDIPVQFSKASSYAYRIPNEIDTCSASSLKIAAQHLAEGLEFYKRGHTTDALYKISLCLELDPNNADACFNTGVLLLSFGPPLTLLAVDFFARVVQLRPNDATAHNVLAKVIFASEPTAVIDAYRSILEKSPDDHSHIHTAHYFSSLTGEGKSTNTADPLYVRAVFDRLASTFEDTLVNHLNYRVPWQMFDCVQDVRPLQEHEEYNWNILDLGCGTGLCGRLFKSYSANGTSVGVDLSPEMVKIAEQNGSYNLVLVEDIHDALESKLQCSQSDLDLIISADTFIYVGDLEKCFYLVSRALSSTGLFTFSVETLDSSNIENVNRFKLLQSGRYAHSEGYILMTAEQANLEILQKRDVVVRQESAMPIDGCIYILQKRKINHG